MNKLTALILFFIVAALVVFIVQYEEEAPTTFDRMELEGRLWSVEPEEVTGFEIEKKGAPAYSLAKREDEWFIEKPLEGPADFSMVSGFLGQVGGIEVTRRMEFEGSPLSHFGLDEPEHVLRVISKDGIRRELKIGPKAPVGTDHYALETSKDDVLVIAPGIVDWLSWGFEEWRDRRALAIDMFDVASLTIVKQGETIKLERPSADWLMTYPIRFPANRELVEQLLASLSRLRIEHFLADGDMALDPYGLDVPRGELKIVARSDGTETVFAWGNEVEHEEGEVACMRRGEASVWTVDLEILKELELGVDDWREGRALTSSPQEVMAVSLKSGETLVELKKAETQEWGRVVEFLRKLRGLKATQFFDEPQELALYGLDQPGALLKVKRDAPAREEGLVIGILRGENEVYAKHEPYTSVFVLDSAAADLIRQEVEFWSQQ